MSSRNCPTERSWFPVDKAWNSGTCKMGASSKRLAAPIAEKPNPDRPLITPERKTIASMLASWRMLNPATAFGAAGNETMSVPVTTSAATAKSHSVVFVDPALAGQPDGSASAAAGPSTTRARWLGDRFNGRFVATLLSLATAVQAASRRVPPQSGVMSSSAISIPIGVGAPMFRAPSKFI